MYLVFNKQRRVCTLKTDLCISSRHPPVNLYDGREIVLLHALPPRILLSKRLSFGQFSSSLKVDVSQGDGLHIT